MNHNALQDLGRARRIVGVHLLTLRADEHPDQVVITEDTVTVILSVVRRVDVRGGSKITHRGVRGHVFKRVSLLGWRLDETIDSVCQLDEPEYELSFGFVTPEEYEAQREFEGMCYRPGTPQFPLDSEYRRSLGY